MSSIGISLFSEKKMMDVPEEYIYAKSAKFCWMESTLDRRKFI